MFHFQDKVVLITGAVKGFGRVLSLAFAERGAKLAICDLDDKGGAETFDLAFDEARFGVGEVLVIERGVTVR